jgi:RNA polymerase sigma factor (sigma-70 family)
MSDLMRLFSLDLGHTPCLERDEEYILARHAREAWQRIADLLAEQRPLVTPFLAEKRKALSRDSLSEQDVLFLLDRLEETRSKPEREGVEVAPREALDAWLGQVREELRRFRSYRDELVRRNLRLVLRLARYYRVRNLGALDLVQEGVLGLMRAVEKFDPERGMRFSTYAVWWIRQAITRALAQGEGVVRPSSYFQMRRSRLLRLIQAWESTPHRVPIQEEVGAIGGKQSGVAAIAALVPVTMVSLDAPMTEADERPLAEILPDPEIASPEEELLKADRKRTLHRVLVSLAPRDAAVLRLRFGLVDEHACTLEEVGQRLNMSRQQVRQREERALSRLKRIYQEAETEGVQRRAS